MSPCPCPCTWSRVGAWRRWVTHPPPFLSLIAVRVSLLTVAVEATPNGSPAVCLEFLEKLLSVWFLTWSPSSPCFLVAFRSVKTWSGTVYSTKWQQFEPGVTKRTLCWDVWSSPTPHLRWLMGNWQLTSVSKTGGREGQTNPFGLVFTVEQNNWIYCKLPKSHNLASERSTILLIWNIQYNVNELILISRQSMGCNWN